LKGLGVERDLDHALPSLLRRWTSVTTFSDYEKYRIPCYGTLADFDSLASEARLARHQKSFSIFVVVNSQLG